MQPVEIKKDENGNFPTQSRVELLDLEQGDVNFIQTVNRHERRRRAKLARRQAVKDRLELEKRGK